MINSFVAEPPPRPFEDADIIVMEPKPDIIGIAIVLIGAAVLYSVIKK